MENRLNHLKTIIVLLVGVLCFSSCQNDEPKINCGREPLPVELVNDLFIDSLIDYNITEKSLRYQFGDSITFKYEAIKNIHDESIIDTLIYAETNSEPKNRYVIYKTINKEIFYSAEIYSSKSSLVKDFKIGMKKIDLENHLKVKINNFAIRIFNKTQTLYWTFYFRKDTLEAILFGGYLD